MFKRVLVALDRFERAQHILPHVKTVACAFGSHINLLHVFQEKSGLGLVDPLDWYMDRGKAQAHLNYVSEELSGSQLPVEPVLLDGPPAERILSYADESGASLIVLNGGEPRRPSALRRQAAGSVAFKVASRTRQSLLVVRQNDKATDAVPGPGAYRRILVPLDGSRRAEHVLPIAAALAAQCRAKVVLAHAVARPHFIGGRSPRSDAAKRIVTRNYEEAASYLEQLRCQLGVPCETRLVVADDPIAALHELRRAVAADLVLLSAHGYSCRKQQPYGRVASSFLYEGDTSLLLVQDLPPHEIGLSAAEQAAQLSGQHTIKRKNTVPTISFN